MERCVRVASTHETTGIHRYRWGGVVSRSLFRIFRRAPYGTSQSAKFSMVRLAKVNGLLSPPNTEVQYDPFFFSAKGLCDIFRLFAEPSVLLAKIDNSLHNRIGSQTEQCRTKNHGCRSYESLGKEFLRTIDAECQ